MQKNPFFFQIFESKWNQEAMFKRFAKDRETFY